MSLHQRIRYWEDGAAMLQSLGGPYEYLCPLCLHCFRRDQIDKLSLGHAPPEGVGGTLQVLVCTDRCECPAGWRLDAHAHRFDLFRRIVQGEPFPATPARLTFEGITVNVQLSSEDASNNDILGLDECNPPGALDQFRAAFERHVQAGTIPSEMHFTLPKLPVSQQHARVAYLRAAYLAAFATFGYSAVARDSYDRVRRQIEEPEVEHAPQFFYRHDDLHGYQVAIVEEPEWLASIVVLVGNFRITLPLGDDDGIYDRLADKAAVGGIGRFMVGPTDGPRSPDTAETVSWRGRAMCRKRIPRCLEGPPGGTRWPSSDL